MTLLKPTALLIGAGLLAIHANADPASTPPAPVYPLAMCSNGQFWHNKDYPPAMLDTGARMVRVDIGFVDVRRKPGDDPNTWNWASFENLRRVKGECPQLEYLPILGYGVTWASEPVPEKSREITGRPRGVDLLPANDPKNLYGHYVYETVRRYKDVCHAWESWNEPDLPGHGFYAGNGRDFMAIQRTCYLAAKAADPQCQVAFAGLCYGNVEGYLATHHLAAPSPYPPTECFFEDYLKECAKDPQAKANHYYFDVMNQHSYSRASDLYDYPAIDRKLMIEYMGEEGKTKPIWITEMGWPDKPGPFGGDQDEYCDYALQSFAWGRLAGVERLFHFQLDNSNGHGLYFEIPKKPKPVLVTYREILAKELADTTRVTQLHGHAGVGLADGNSVYKPTWQTGYNAFEFTGAAGKRVLMAFSDTDKAITIQLPAKAQRATLIDRHNQRTPIEAKNGAYEVQLAGATNRAGWPVLDDPKAKALGEPEHLVGGATVVIVEDAGK